MSGEPVETVCPAIRRRQEARPHDFAGRPPVEVGTISRRSRRNQPWRTRSIHHTIQSTHDARTHGDEPRHVLIAQTAAVSGHAPGPVAPTRSLASEAALQNMRVVLDTNIFVAAGFSRASASARIVEAARNRELQLVWDDATRAEIERIVRKIPPLDYRVLEGLFMAENRFHGDTHPQNFTDVTDPDDRKFAALAHAAGAVLVSNDQHLLGPSLVDRVTVLTPSAFWSSA
jgi:uncharacterized protein